MKRLTFLIHPPSLKTASDVIGSRTVEELSRHGVNAQLINLWPDSLAQVLRPRDSWCGKQIYKRLVSPLSTFRLYHRFNQDDIVWMYDISRFGLPGNCRLENHLVASGANFVFQFHDSWLSTTGYNEAARVRLFLASLVGGVTKGILHDLSSNANYTTGELLPAPIDVSRLHPISKASDFSLPRVVWTGSPYNLREIPNVQAVLKSVYDQCPFDFVVICGSAKPSVDLSIPWTWHPYSSEEEAARISGASGGLAPLPDTPYAKCKDVFKVKTYMACGVPPITSRIGNNLSVVKDGETGFLVNSAKEWESRLLELVSNPVKAEIMGQAAREDCVKRFSHEAIIPEWIEVLERHFGPIRNGVAE